MEPRWGRPIPTLPHSDNTSHAGVSGPGYIEAPVGECCIGATLAVCCTSRLTYPGAGQATERLHKSVSSSADRLSVHKKCNEYTVCSDDLDELAAVDFESGTMTAPFISPSKKTMVPISNLRNIPLVNIVRNGSAQTNR